MNTFNQVLSGTDKTVFELRKLYGEYGYEKSLFCIGADTYTRYALQLRRIRQELFSNHFDHFLSWRRGKYGI